MLYPVGYYNSFAFKDIGHYWYIVKDQSSHLVHLNMCIK